MSQEFLEKLLGSTHLWPAMFIHGEFAETIICHNCIQKHVGLWPLKAHPKEKEAAVTRFIDSHQHQAANFHGICHKCLVECLNKCWGFTTAGKVLAHAKQFMASLCALDLGVWSLNCIKRCMQSVVQKGSALCIGQICIEKLFAHSTISLGNRIYLWPMWWWYWQPEKIDSTRHRRSGLVLLNCECDMGHMGRICGGSKFMNPRVGLG